MMSSSQIYQQSETFAGVHYVIDVNYFPSYKGVPDARAALGGLLERKLIASK